MIYDKNVYSSVSIEVSRQSLSRMYATTWVRSKELGGKGEFASSIADVHLYGRPVQGSGKRSVEDIDVSIPIKIAIYQCVNANKNPSIALFFSYCKDINVYGRCVLQ